MPIRDILNHETGRLFRMRIIREGDAYGVDMALVHEGDPVVEFYDAAHDFSRDPEGRPLGQFVSRYFVDTLKGEGEFAGPDVFAADRGLNLDGGVDVWSIDAEGMADVEIALLDEGLVSELSSVIAVEKLATADQPGQTFP